MDDGDTLSSKYRVEGHWKLRIAVVDQEALGECAVLDVPTQVTSLLRDPRTGWVRRAPSQMDAPRAEFNKEEDVDRFQPHGFHREEITRQDLLVIVV